jgi:phosphoribosylformylglycinamidine synthase
MPRSGLLDPQGQAIAHALASLGFERVGDVRVGRELEITLDGESAGEVRERLTAMCERLLANPVTEDYAVDAVEAAR